MTTIPTTAAQLADAYGDVDAQIKALEKRRDAIKAILGQHNMDVFEGARYTLTRTSYVQDRLDTKRLAADLGDDILAQYRTQAQCSRITVRLAPVALAA